MKWINLIILATSTFAFGLVVGCKKDAGALPPTPANPFITTKPVTNISSTSVVSGGELTNANNITDKGIVWGTDSSTLIVSNINKISNGPGVANFTDTIQNLQPGATYYLRAYAVSSSGIVYGAALKFTTSQPSVYVAGYHGALAAYWKNGKLFPLTNGTYAHSIFVVGNDVYVAGEYNNGNLQAMYWKNGIPVALTNGVNAAIANSIYVVGNDVYVAGYELMNNDPNSPVAKYWKNGVGVPLTAGTGSNSGIAYSICVNGNDVYVAGFTSNHFFARIVATYWKNGIAVPLNDSNTTHGYARSIFVNGSDVYVAGYEKPGLGINGITKAKYWKNGVPVSLTDGSQFASANCIYVAGNDVYVAGNEEDALTGYSVGKYWKNGIAFPLTDGSKYGDAYSIRVVGNDVYVAGGEDDYLDSKCWKNGAILPLEINTTYSRSVSIFVQ